MNPFGNDIRLDRKPRKNGSRKFRFYSACPLGEILAPVSPLAISPRLFAKHTAVHTKSERASRDKTVVFISQMASLAHHFFLSALTALATVKSGRGSQVRNTLHATVRRALGQLFDQKLACYIRKLDNRYWP